MVQTTDSKEFIEIIFFLKKQKGISKKQISKDISVPYYKINNILDGKSSADFKILNALKEKYSDLLEEGDQPDLKEKVDALEEEMEQMKKENMEMKNMLLKLQNELLTKKK